jgi:hypothetical protein
MSDLDPKVAKLRYGASHALPNHAGVHPATKAIPDDKLTSGDLMHAVNVLDHADNIARCGGQPKRFLGEAPAIHGVMFHVENGVMKQSISKIQNAAEAPDGGSPNPQDPTVPGKRFAPVAVHPGMASRSANHETGVALGAKILGEAILSGSSRLPSK